MSEVAFASDAMQQWIAPPGVAQSVKERIGIAARKLGWSFGRTRAVWYADERVALRPRELRRIEEMAGVRYGREEVREVSDLIRQADALLLGVDPDFHRPFVAAFRAFFGALDRSRVEGRDE